MERFCFSLCVFFLVLPSHVLASSLGVRSFQTRVLAQAPTFDPNMTVYDYDVCPEGLIDGVDSQDQIYELIEDSSAEIFLIQEATSQLDSSTKSMKIRCPAQKGSVTVIGNSQPGQVIYEPGSGKFGCDLWSWEVEDSAADDLRYRTMQFVLVTILSQNDPPGNLPNYFYNTPEDQLNPNRNDFVDPQSYPTSGDNRQRMLRQLEPVAGYDEDEEILRYAITKLPTNGTLWIEDKDGNLLCTASPNNMCEAIGDANWFSYLPNAESQNFDDTFSYVVDDCLAPRASHLGQGSAGACTSGVNMVESTVHVVTGGFQGTVVVTEVGDKVVDPQSNYTGSNPLLGLEDVPVLGYFAYVPESGMLPNDLIYTPTIPPRNGFVVPVCGGKMVKNWGNSIDPATLLPCDQTILDAALVTQYSGQIGAFYYTGEGEYSGTDFFRFATYSESFLNGTSSTSTTAVNINLDPVNDVPVLVPFSESSGTTTGAGMLQGHVQMPMFDGSVNPGFLTLHGRDNDTEVLYAQMLTNFTHGKLYRNVSTVVDSQNVSVQVVDFSSEVHVGEVMKMNLPNSTARSDTFTLVLYYLPSQIQTHGAAYDSAAFRILDHETNHEGHASAQSTALIQVQCAAGYYVLSDQVDVGSGYHHGSCSPCPPGSFGKDLHQAACSPCEQGSFSETAAPVCDPCPEDTYQNLTGQTSCQACPLNRDTTRGVTSITNAIRRKQLVDCVCQAWDEAGTDWMDEMKRGFYGPYGEPCYTCPGPSDGTGLAEWVTCYEDGMRYPVSNAGYFTDTKVLPVVIRQCLPLDACPGHTTQQEMLDKPCKDGYMDHGCSMCDTGYSRFFGKCSQCPATNAAISALVGLVGYPLFFLIMTYSLCSSVKSHPDIAISFNYSQIAGMFGQYQMRWPAGIDALLKSISFVNISPELIRPECSFTSWDYSSNWTIVNFAPIMFIMWIIITSGMVLVHREFTKIFGPYFERNYPSLFQRVTAKPNTMERYKQMMKIYLGILLTKSMDKKEVLITLRKQLHAALTFFNMAYTFLVLKFFEYLECSQNIDANFYLVSEPSVQCYQFDQTYIWGKLLPGALASLIFYVIGIPALIGYLLHSIQHNLNGKAPLDLIGSVYSRYDHMWFAWELQILMQKFFLAAALFLFSTESNVNALRQALFAMTVLLTSLTLHSYAAPYDKWYLNQFQTVCTMCTYFQVFAGLMFTGDMSTSLKESLTNVVLFIVWIPWLTIIFTKSWFFYQVGRGWYNKHKHDQEEKQRLKDLAKSKEEAKGFSLAMQLKLNEFANKMEVHKHAEFFMTDVGMRLTKELWYESKHDPTILVPTLEELEPLFDSLFEAIDDSATLDLSGEDISTTWDRALRGKGMVLETLAQNKVEDNLEIRETIEKILAIKESQSIFGQISTSLKAVLARFDAERARAGSSYTQQVALEQKNARKAARLAKAQASRSVSRQPSRANV